MTRSELLAAIRSEHMKFLTCIGGIPDRVMIDEPFMGEMTIKDLMAHIAVWMRVALKFVQEHQAGLVPTSLGLNDDAKVNAFNAAAWDARRDLPLAQVIGELGAAYGELVAAVERLSDAELIAPLPEPWDAGTTLEKLIAVNTTGHEPEHASQVLAWREEYEEEEDD